MINWKITALERMRVNTYGDARLLGPLTIDGELWTAATDGHAALAVRGEVMSDCEGSSAVAGARIAHVLEGPAEVGRISLLALSQWTQDGYREREICARCRGQAGKAKCTKCHGSGRRFVDCDDCRDGHECVCKCDDGKLHCTACDDTGHVVPGARPARLVVGEKSVVINKDLLWKVIAGCPGADVRMVIDGDCVFMRADEWHGVAMRMENTEPVGAELVVGATAQAGAAP